MKQNLGSNGKTRFLTIFLPDQTFRMFFKPISVHFIVTECWVFFSEIFMISHFFDVQDSSRRNSCSNSLNNLNKSEKSTELYARKYTQLYTFTNTGTSRTRKDMHCAVTGNLQNLIIACSYFALGGNHENENVRIDTEWANEQKCANISTLNKYEQ